MTLKNKLTLPPKIFSQTRNDTRRNNETNKLRVDDRISLLSGRLQSIHGRKPDEIIYLLLVDNVVVINIIKKDLKNILIYLKFCDGRRHIRNYRSHARNIFW